MTRYVKHFIACAMLIAGASLAAAAGEASAPDVPAELRAAQTANVRIDGVVLFPVRGISAYPARERAAAIAARIIAIAEDPAVKIETVGALDKGTSTDIAAGDRAIMSVFDEDAALEGVDRRHLAAVYIKKVRAAIEAYRSDRAAMSLTAAAAYALIATFALAAAHFLIGFLIRRLTAVTEARFTAKIRVLQERSHDIVRTEAVWAGIRGALGAARIVLVLVAVLLYVQVVLGLFPWTRAFAVPMLDMLVGPLRSMAAAVLEYLPSLAFLVILAVLTRYGLRALKAFFLGIQRGTIAITGFDPAWASPVYKIARLGVIAFAVVVAYPYIPGSESPAFKGVSLFLGVVFSLGSSSSVANIVAGYMVIFRRAFKVGDRVRIGGSVGDVVEMRLQATHLRTIKNEEIIVPNSTILNTEVVNYSSLARQGGLILHTTVTIGYDAPWRQVHAMLLQAADRTAGLLKEPKPFVLQTGLNDFYVSYELNAYTDRPKEMAAIYSDLHQNIQDAFNEYGVQIMSPHYYGDPAKEKVVPKDRWHQAPALRQEKDGGPKR